MYQVCIHAIILNRCVFVKSSPKAEVNDVQKSTNGTTIFRECTLRDSSIGYNEFNIYFKLINWQHHELLPEREIKRGMNKHMKCIY